MHHNDLSPRTDFIGHQIIRLLELDSTNNYATELAQTDQWADGTVIIADYQTGGRGQRGSVWQSLRGANLLVTVMLRPSARGPLSPVKLNMAVALALHDCLSWFAVSAPLWIKWPNDIISKDGKLAGVLVENHYSGDRFERALVGIGVNVNQTAFARLNATSLRLLSGITYSVEEVLFKLSAHLERRYLSAFDSKSGDLAHDYHHAFYGLGEKRRFSDNLEEFRATVEGTDSHGRLMLQMEDGTRRHFDSKSVVWEEE